MKGVGVNTQEEIDVKTVTLPDAKGKKLLIFDMDETLIHCLSSAEEDEETDFSKEVDVEIQLPKSKSGKDGSIL